MKLGRRVEAFAITAIDRDGLPYGPFEGGKLYVDKSLPGDIADVQAIRVSKGDFPVSTGRIVRLLQASPDRIDPFCPHFEHCGGCQWQHTSYAHQLEIKHGQVSELFARHLPDGMTVPPVLPSPQQLRYRNKIVFTFSNRRWMTPEEKTSPDTIRRPAAGFLMRGKYDHTLEIHECALIEPIAVRILHRLRDIALEAGMKFYDMREEYGFLRGLALRFGDPGHLLAAIITAEQDDEKLNVLTEGLTRDFPEITGYFQLFNPDKSGVNMDAPARHLRGETQLPMSLGGFQFLVSPNAFFQTNTEQTLRLYQTALDFAALKGSERVLDLYCGTGTISLFLARQAAFVTGVEFVDAAVNDARTNANRNGIKNVDFIAGDLKDEISRFTESSTEVIDVVVTDPPRAGHHREVNQALLKLAPKRIVYISCNPITQERDTHMLSDRYRLTRIQPVDMFPHTGHVENVVLLERRD
ncbi:MAG TPA: 23S rRNA (uracil(1939)-C(5))-methyltransferase RlmD [Bacteroidia bacterium]|nr:23S rRNA (uracil(1939)-C(5))-methyltransferase RlmD [Bacteroidia bacterium]